MSYKRWIVVILISMLVLAGCSSPTPTITPVITAPSGTSAPDFHPSGGGVIASGVVVPAQQANLGVILPARIKSVDVVEGEIAKEGRVLVQLAGREGLEAAVAAAEFDLLNAQQAADMALAQSKLDWVDALDALDDAEYQWNVNQPGNRATASALKDAKADVTITEQRLSQARKQLEKAEAGRQKHRLRAHYTMQRERITNPYGFLLGSKASRLN